MKYRGFFVTGTNTDVGKTIVTRSVVRALVHRAAATFDFFIFSLLTGVIIAAGLILDQPALKAGTPTRP